MLRILGRSSSINVRKVLWTCAEIGVGYEQEQWGQGFKSPEASEFLALNPNGKVPVIQDGDFVLWESNAICRYLAAKHERSDLLPQDAKTRAVVEQWMDWQATELSGSCRYAFMALVRKSAAHQDPAALEASKFEWTRNMQILERHLQDTGAYMVGETFTLADVVIGLSVNRWFVVLSDRPELPAVSAYYDRLGQRPGFVMHGRNGMP